MKTIKIALICSALMVLAAPVLALGPLDVNADLALNSKYVWRGMTVTDDFVIQPGISASVGGFGFGFWGNIDTSDYNDTEWKFNEIDYILTYGLSLPKFSFEAGFIYYDFPNLDLDSTSEIYLSASASILLSPSLAVYQDIDQIKGAYWEASISHGMPLSPAANLDFSATLGLGSKSYLMGYFGAIPDIDNPDDLTDFTGASMSDFTFSAGLPFTSIPFFTITPGVTYTTLLGDAKEAAEGSERETDTFYYGITASFSF